MHGNNDDAATTLYFADYQAGVALKNIVDAFPGSALLGVHHTRKASSDDFVDDLSGTLGLAGSADYVARPPASAEQQRGHPSSHRPRRTRRRVRVHHRRRRLDAIRQRPSRSGRRSAEPPRHKEPRRPRPRSTGVRQRPPGRRRSRRTRRAPRYQQQRRRNLPTSTALQGTDRQTCPRHLHATRSV